MTYKKFIIIVITLLLLSGCVYNSNSTDNKSNTNSVTNAAIQPSYPYFTPWWFK